MPKGASERHLRDFRDPRTVVDRFASPTTIRLLPRIPLPPRSAGPAPPSPTWRVRPPSRGATPRRSAPTSFAMTRSPMPMAWSVSRDPADLQAPSCKIQRCVRTRRWMGASRSLAPSPGAATRGPVGEGARPFGGDGCLARSSHRRRPLLTRPGRSGPPSRAPAALPRSGQERGVDRAADAEDPARGTAVSVIAT
jgi:hypothetical protein